MGRCRWCYWYDVRLKLCFHPARDYPGLDPENCPEFWDIRNPEAYETLMEVCPEDPRLAWKRVRRAVGLPPMEEQKEQTSQIDPRQKLITEWVREADR